MVMYLYSMESMVYRDLETATRNGDLAVVNTLGPFAKIMEVVVGFAAKYRTDIRNIGPVNAKTLFRGGFLYDW